MDTSSREAISIQKFDARLVPDGAWKFGIVFDHHLSGGTGHAGAFDARITVAPAVGTPSNFYVGVDGFCFTAGGGMCFGVNGYGQALPGAPPATSISGAEFNTDAQVPVQLKNGLQVVDVASSAYHGSVIDAGIWLAKQPGAAGWRDAIRMAADPGATFPSTETVLRATGGSIQRGIDLRGMSFSSAAINLEPGYTTGRIQWGSGDAQIWSDGQVMVIRGGRTMGVQVDIEDDYVVFRRADGKCLVLDWNSGSLVPCQ